MTSTRRRTWRGHVPCTGPRRAPTAPAAATVCVCCWAPAPTSRREWLADGRRSCWPHGPGTCTPLRCCSDTVSCYSTRSQRTHRCRRPVGLTNRPTSRREWLVDGRRSCWPQNDFAVDSRIIPRAHCCDQRRSCMPSSLVSTNTD